MTRWNLIVVGIDGSKESREALHWACEEATTHGQAVLAVAVWTPPAVPIDPPFGSFPWGTTTELADSVRAMLDEVVTQTSADFPTVTIRQEVATGNAAQQLISASEHADLVVVGAKGHGGFTGMLIGSVSQHVLAHSHCTVVVVR